MLKHQTILTRARKIFYSITTKEMLVHLVIFEVRFENKPSLQAKVVFRNFVRSSLFSTVHCAGKPEIFLAAGVSEPPIQT